MFPSLNKVYLRFFLKILKDAHLDMCFLSFSRSLGRFLKCLISRKGNRFGNRKGEGKKHIRRHNQGLSMLWEEVQLRSCHQLKSRAAECRHWSNSVFLREKNITVNKTHTGSVSTNHEMPMTEISAMLPLPPKTILTTF